MRNVKVMEIRLVTQIDHPSDSNIIYAAAASAAKSLQSCPTLSDLMDCSLPGSSVHGIFQSMLAASYFHVINLESE